MSTAPKFKNLTIPPHLHPYQAPPANYLAHDTSTSIPITHLVASAVVIHSNRVLLLQRAAHAFQPLLWELPGGKCSVDDASIISAAARELWEESGLVASRVVDVVGKYEWLDRGEVWRKVVFLMEVDVKHEDGGDGNGDGMPRVNIELKEQAGFVWASREDVLKNECDGVALEWTSEEQRQIVLDGFEVPSSCVVDKSVST